jgi:ABC-type multidrug transport system fused ATPase/permease subunit
MEPEKTDAALGTLSATVKDARNAPSASLRLLFDGARRGVEAPDPDAVEGSEDGGKDLSSVGLPPSGLARPEPARGPRGFKGVAAVVREMALGQAEVAPLLEPYRRQMNAARLMLIAKAGLSTAMAYSVGALVDAALAGALPSVMLWLGALAAVTVVKAVNQRFYAVVASGLRERLRRDFRLRLFEILLRMKDPGEDAAQLASRLSVDVGRITTKNVTIPIQFPHLVIQFALATGFLVASSPLIAAIALVALPLLGWLSWRYGRRSAALQERAATQGADTTRIAAEHLARLPADEAGRNAAVESYREGVDGFLKTMLDLFRIYANFDALREVLQAAFTDILTLGVGLTSFLLTGAPTIGHVMSLRGYAKDLRGAVDGIVDAYTDGKEAEGGTRRILELLRGAPAQPPAPSR